MMKRSVLLVALVAAACGASEGVSEIAARTDGLTGIELQGDFVTVHLDVGAAWSARAYNGEKLPDALDGQVLDPGTKFDMLAIRLPAATQQSMTPVPWTSLPETAVYQRRDSRPSGPMPSSLDGFCALSKAKNHEGDAICGNDWVTQTIVGGEQGRGDLSIQVTSWDVHPGGRVAFVLSYTRITLLGGDVPVYCRGQFTSTTDGVLGDDLSLPPGAVGQSFHVGCCTGTPDCVDSIGEG